MWASLSLAAASFCVTILRCCCILKRFRAAKPSIAEVRPQSLDLAVPVSAGGHGHCTSQTGHSTCTLPRDRTTRADNVPSLPRIMITCRVPHLSKTKTARDSSPLWLDSGKGARDKKDDALAVRDGSGVKVDGFQLVKSGRPRV